MNYEDDDADADADADADDEDANVDAEEYDDDFFLQDVSEVDVEDEVTKEYAVDLNLLLIIFTITVVSVLGKKKYTKNTFIIFCNPYCFNSTA